MNPTTLTPIQRLRSETPKFWVIVQLICLIGLGIAGALANYHVIPGTAYIAVASAVSGVAFISQFAVKNGAEIAQLLADPSKLLEHMPEIIDLFKQLHENAAKVSPTGGDLEGAPAPYPPMQAIPGDKIPDRPVADIREGA